MRRFQFQIKKHPINTEDLVGEGESTIIRCFSDDDEVEISQMESALLADETMKRWNMHNELIEALSNLKSQVDTLQLEDRIKSLPNERRNLLSANLVMASKLLKQAEQK